jgi:dephospho-CoA kinase
MHSFLTFWICCSFLWWLAVANTLQPIGITGGIACGKSTICKILKKQDNVAIVDLDEIAHDVQRPPKKGEAVMNNCYQTILETFPGKKITKRDGSIDRKKLGDIVFADPAKRRLLEAIMRPKIMQAMVWRMVTGKMFRTNTKLMIEAPLLFEAPILRYIFVSEARAQTRALKESERTRRRGASADAGRAQTRSERRRGASADAQRAQTRSERRRAASADAERAQASAERDRSDHRASTEHDRREHADRLQRREQTIRSIPTYSSLGLLRSRARFARVLALTPTHPRASSSWSASRLTSSSSGSRSATRS